MKKYIVTAVMASLLVVGTQAVNTVAATGGSVPFVRVLDVQDIAQIFAGKYPGGVLHSVELDPGTSNFDYKVKGFANGKMYTMQVDVLTGEIKKEKTSGLRKEMVTRVIRPAAMISQKAASAVAVQTVGEGSVVKDWKLTAEQDNVIYDVTVAYNEMQTTVTIDATSGVVLAKTEPEFIDIVKEAEEREELLSKKNTHSPIRLD